MAFASGGGTFALSLEMRSGSAQAMYSGTTSVVTEYDATIPAGKVGVWAGSGSAAVKADNFKVRDLAGFYTVDGRFVDDSGNVRVTGGKLEFYNSDGVTRRAVCDAVRMGKGVTQVDLVFRTGIDAGVILHCEPKHSGFAASLVGHKEATLRSSIGEGRR